MVGGDGEIVVLNNPQVISQLANPSCPTTHDSINLSPPGKLVSRQGFNSNRLSWRKLFATQPLILAVAPVSFELARGSVCG